MIDSELIYCQNKARQNIEDKENELNNLLSACKRTLNIHSPC